MISLHQTSSTIGFLGVVVIVFGVVNGLWRFARSELRSVRGLDVDEERKRLRHLLGYHLLLGLEFLIAADIIDTLMKPTPQDLLVLGTIIVIRTVISWSLNAELRPGSAGILPASSLSRASEIRRRDASAPGEVA